ncbi:hypothetical protein MKX29_11800 [Cytobacillus sp. FSL R7-0696]
MKKKKDEESKMKTDDDWNRTFYGTPTVGGMAIVLAIIGYIIYQVLMS